MHLVGFSTKLDSAPIRKLAEDLSAEAALRFVDDYLGMLPGRWKRILRAVDQEDAKVALDALLSLRVTSSMSGALDTAASCRELESLVRAGHFPQARAEATRLSTELHYLQDAAPDLLQRARDELSRTSWN